MSYLFYCPNIQARVELQSADVEALMCELSVCLLNPPLLVLHALIGSLLRKPPDLLKAFGRLMGFYRYLPTSKTGKSSSLMVT